LQCTVHPETAAAGVCTRCGKFHCQECLVEVSGKNLCRNCVTHAFQEQKEATSRVSAAAAPIVINNNASSSSSASATASAASPFSGAITKSPGLAAVMSLFIPGLGQLYCGRMMRAIAFFIGTVVTVPFFIGLGVWLWNIIDAYNVAKRYPMP
jgi:TM2 domain-containing membrane protein YozV